MAQRQGTTVVQSISLPVELSDEIDKAWYRYKRKMLNQKTSRSKFISMMIQKGLQS